MVAGSAGDKKLLAVRVPQATYDQLAELAEQRGTTVSAQVNQALAQYIANDGQVGAIVPQEIGR